MGDDRTSRRVRWITGDPLEGKRKDRQSVPADHDGAAVGRRSLAVDRRPRDAEVEQQFVERVLVVHGAAGGGAPADEEIARGGAGSRQEEPAAQHETPAPGDVERGAELAGKDQVVGKPLQHRPWRTQPERIGIGMQQVAGPQRGCEHIEAAEPELVPRPRCAVHGQRLDTGQAGAMEPRRLVHARNRHRRADRRPRLAQPDVEQPQIRRIGRCHDLHRADSMVRRGRAIGLGMVIAPRPAGRRQGAFRWWRPRCRHRPGRLRGRSCRGPVPYRRPCGRC